MGIANIHSVRRSFEAMQLAQDVPEKRYLSQVDQSNWLQQLSAVLQGAKVTAEQLEAGFSVLCHCSDGWDRTPQITSLAQMMIDAHYRTIVGFCQLIEKEWVEFGHQFRLRLGHQNDSDPHKRSQVFIQFLDAVHQILIQFPSSFEFNEKLLLKLAHHCYTCRFGTFLMNSYKERKEARVFKSTPSVWSYVLSRFKLFLNPYFIPSVEGVIYPNTSAIKLEIWHSYFSKWHRDFYTDENKANYKDSRERLMEKATCSLETLKVKLNFKQMELEHLRRSVSDKGDLEQESLMLDGETRPY